MAQITSTLPVEFSGNNSSYQYTREKPILEMSVQSPKYINYLPAERAFEIITCSYDGIMTRNGNCFHFDFNYLPRVESTYLIKFNMNNIFNETKGKTYTLTYRISNCTQRITSKTTWWRAYNFSGSSYKDLQSGKVIENGIYSLTFVSEHFNISTIGWQHERFVNAYDFSFDLEIISLVEGDIPLHRGASTCTYNPVVVVTNDHAILGEYELSRKIRRHLIQTERSITAMQDLFSVSWR